MMKEEVLSGRRGYPIPALSTLNGTEKRSVLVIHGFASSRYSDTGVRLAERLAAQNIGVYAIDLPAHGASTRDELHIDECLDSMADAAQRMRLVAPQTEIFLFGSSFGGYLAILYLALRDPSIRRAMLRCAAVNMPELMDGDLTPALRAEIERQGYYIFDPGYSRTIRITRAFFDELHAHDAFALADRFRTSLQMIHGTNDEEVPLPAVQRFAAQTGAALRLVEGAGHRFAEPGATETVLDVAERFFTA